MPAFLYQQRLLADGSDIGAPRSRLPDDLPKGLSLSALADLDQVLTGELAEAYAGTGFFVVAPPPPVPDEIERLWARLALETAGLLATVEAAVAAADTATQIYWADAASFRRDSPVLLSMTEALGLTSDQVDDLFRAAAAAKAAAGA